MPQIPSGDAERGLTTVEPHELHTWGAESAASPAKPSVPTTQDMPTTIAFLKSIRDRRGKNR